jgi:glyoxylase-like metal-dependent hydrolase (beta-lactamase superfamily II)
MPLRRRRLALAPLLPLLPLAPLAGWLGGCAPLAPAATDTATDTATLQQVAPGVYLWQGLAGEIDAGNGGRVGNAGFIVGDRGVLVIDSGASRRHGLALLAAVRRTTTQPVRALLLTQARQEFVFGAAVFQQQGVPVLMGRHSAQLMAARCEGCLKALKRQLGEALMGGTELAKATLLLDDRSGLPAPGRSSAAAAAALAAAATDIGRPLRLLGYGHSSGPGDIAVLDERSGVLFAGGLADVGRIPDVQDADLPGWLQALSQLRALPLQRVVPGHGPHAAPQALAEVQRYLEALDARARTLARDGVALSEVPDACALPSVAAWDQYDTIHRRNAAILFLRHERQLLRE